MRRFTLVLASLLLIFLNGGGNLKAQTPEFTPITSLDELTTGWYQMKVGNGTKTLHVETKGRYLTSRADKSTEFSFKVEEDVASAVRSLVYVEKLSSSYKIYNLQGYTMASNSKPGVASGLFGTSYTLSITMPEEGQFKIGSTIYIDRTSGVFHTWQSSSASDCRFQFSDVDSHVAEHLNVWTVEITGLSAGNHYVTYNNADYTGVATVLSGGKYLLAKDVTPLPADFEPDMVENMIARPVIDPEEHTITINYVPLTGDAVTLHHNAIEFNTLVESVTVGPYVYDYPQTAVDNAKKAIKAAEDKVYAGGTVTVQDVTNLETAKSTFESQINSFDENGTYMFVNTKTGKDYGYVMLSENFDIRWGAKVEGRNSQYWILTPNGDDTYKIKNGDGYYMAAEGDYPNENRGGEFFFMTDAEEAAANVTFTHIAQGSFLIKIGNNHVAHAEGHNGTSGDIISYEASAGVNDPSAWRLLPMSGYNEYNVVITGKYPPIAAVTRTNGSVTETAYNGGVFLTTGENLEGELNASSLDAFTRSEPTITGKTITVNFTLDDAAYSTLMGNTISDAQILLNTRGIGYPLEISQAYSDLNSAIEIAKGKVAPFEGMELFNLERAVEAYNANTSGIQMPEVGKAYWFVNKLHESHAMYVGGTSENRDLLWTTLAEDDIRFCWIVEQDGSNQKLVNGEGYYMGSDLAPVTDKAAAGNIVFHSKGYGVIGFKCAGGSDVHAQTSGHNIVKWNGDAKSASAWIVEEVSFLNNIRVGGQIGDEYVGTFSAPFATTVPAGVEAHTITGKNGDYAAISEPLAAGTVIPANEGVLLVSQTPLTDAFTLPTTAAATESFFTNNLLEAGTGVAVDAAVAYILANGIDGIGFYQLGSNDRVVARGKAYLTGLSDAAVLKLNFGGNLTGIDSIDNGELTIDNGTVYDLSGRVVNAPVKGGIYIKNGKKYIVK